MKTPIIKPDLRFYFAGIPQIGIWMEREWNNAKTFEDIANLFHKWNKNAEETDNMIHKNMLIGSANYIYSYFTNKSFETKKFEQI